MNILRLIVLIAAMAAQAPTPQAPAIVFVCEHGAAKSVIATAYFNKLAAERHLPFRATFRGTTPQDDLSVRAVEGLKADGVPVPAGKPAAITGADVAGATHIFAIGCPLPEAVRRSGKAADWSDVPDDRGYGPMRDAIVRHVEQLLADLGTRQDPLRQVAVVPLPGVTGRIDHLAFDPARQRLFVAALGHDSVEVVDAARGAHLKSLSGFHEPQGLAVVPDLGVAVANGSTGTIQLVDAQTFTTRWTLPVGGDADNVRYDAAAKRLYVAAEGGLYAVDPAAGKIAGRIAIDGHPESFQLATAGAAVFANLPGLLSSQVIGADRHAMAVTARWPTQGCGGNYPMALAEPTSRLFVGCRRPARLAMIDTRSGSFLTSIDIVGDTDDLFYDDTRRRLYVIGGDGFVDVIARDADRLERIGRVPTRGGARTGLWVPSQGRLYVAVPQRSGQPAEVRVFEATSAAGR